jgi:hypothetical protein
MFQSLSKFIKVFQSVYDLFMICLWFIFWVFNESWRESRSCLKASRSYFGVLQSCLIMSLYYLRMNKSCLWVVKNLLLVSTSFRMLWKSYASRSKSCLWESGSYLKASRNCLEAVSKLSRSCLEVVSKCLWFVSRVSMTCWRKCRSCVKVPIWWLRMSINRWRLSINIFKVDHGCFRVPRSCLKVSMSCLKVLISFSKWLKLVSDCHEVVLKVQIFVFGVFISYL